MTKDTERALEIMAPMAKEFGIEINADDRFLYCNGQAIGICDNSTYATLKEFVGYVMWSISRRDYRYHLSRDFENQIKQFWVSKEQIKKMELRG